MGIKLSLESVSQIRDNGGQKVIALNEVSALIRSGEVYTVLGPSGSGKSTLLRLINRLDDPSSGRILLDGTDIREMSVFDLRRRAGMVFQSPAVLDGTVELNIQYGARLAGTTVDTNQFLDKVGLHREFAQRSASSLSGGEQQRVSIARALATNPEILLMDEPTSSLDPAARIQIETLALELNRSDGLTIIFVTHDMEQARRIGTRTMLLVGGCRIEEVDTEEFFADPKEDISRRFIGGSL